jgi:hypothetical protein
MHSARATSVRSGWRDNSHQNSTKSCCLQPAVQARNVVSQRGQEVASSPSMTTALPRECNQAIVHLRFRSDQVSNDRRRQLIGSGDAIVRKNAEAFKLFEHASETVG